MSKKCWNVYTNVNGKSLEFNSAKEFTEYLNQNPVELARFSNSIKGIEIEESTKPIIKEGVAELFESNPELANAVYEAVGFNVDSNITIKESFNPDIPEATTYALRIDNKYAGLVAVDNNGTINSSIGQTGVELEPEFRGKGLGKKIYLKVAQELLKQGKTLKSELFGKDNINEDATRVWKSLVRDGYAVDKGDYYEISNILTPQQKQQAQQLYSQYLSTITNEPVLFKGFRNKSGKVHKTPNHLFFSPDRNIAEKWYKDEKGVKTFIVSKQEAENFKADYNQSIPNVRKEEESFINNSKTPIIRLETNDIGGTQIQYVIKKDIDVLELGSNQDIEGFKEFINQQQASENIRFSINNLITDTEKTEKLKSTQPVVEQTQPEVVEEKPTEVLQEEAKQEVAELENKGREFKNKEVTNLTKKQKEAVEFIKNNFSDIEVGIFDRLDEKGLTNGYFDLAGNIMLSLTGPILETAHHESFHALFNNYLTPAQKELLLREAKNTYEVGEETLNLLANQYGKDLSNPKDLEFINTIAYEEAMAEDFVSYMQTGDTVAKGDIRSFFVRLLEFISNLFKNNNQYGNIRTAFEILKRGKAEQYFTKQSTLSGTRYSRNNPLSIDEVEYQAFRAKMYSDVYNKLANKVLDGSAFSFTELTTNLKRFYRDLGESLVELIEEYKSDSNEVVQKALSNLDLTSKTKIANTELEATPEINQFIALIDKDLQEAFSYAFNNGEFSDIKKIFAQYGEELETKLSEKNAALVIGLAAFNLEQSEQLIDAVLNDVVTDADLQVTSFVDYTPLVETLNSYLRNFGIKSKINAEILNGRIKNLEDVADIIEENTTELQDEFEGDFAEEEELKLSKDAAWNQADNEIGVSSKLSSEVKLFLASLEDKSNYRTKQSMGLNAYLNPARAYNTLLSFTKNNLSMQEIKDSVNKLADIQPSFKPVADLLNVDITKLKSEVQAKTVDDIYANKLAHLSKLQNSLFRSLYKAEVSYSVLENKDGELIFSNPIENAQAQSLLDTIDRSLRKVIESKVYDDVVALENNRVIIKNRKRLVDRDVLEAIFDNGIGDKVGVENRALFVSGLKNSIVNVTSKEESVFELYNDQGEFRNALKDVASKMISSEHSYLTAEGKRAYALMEYNADLYTISSINKAQTLEELYESLPHLKSLTNKNSYLITKKLFNADGTRKKGVSISPTIIGGLKNGEEGSSYAKMSEYDKTGYQLSLVLSGMGYTITPSDKTLLFGFEIKGDDSFAKDLYSEDGEAILFNALIDEITDEATRTVASISKVTDREYEIQNYDKNSKKILLYEAWVKPDLMNSLQELAAKSEFESLEDVENNRELIKDLVRANFNRSYLDSRASVIDSLYNEYKDVIKNILFDNNKQFQNAIKNKESLFKKAAMLEALTYAQSFHLSIGDPALFKNLGDLYKRAGGPKGTKEMLLSEDNSIEKFKTVFGDTGIEGLDAKFHKGVTFKSVMGNVDTATREALETSLIPHIKTYLKQLDSNLSEAELNSLAKTEAQKRVSYLSNVNEADGQSWITFEGYRWYKYLMGEWSWKQEFAYRKAQKGESLTKEEITYFQPIKSQYYGPSNIENLNVQSFLKHSMMPILPQYYKGIVNKDGVAQERNPDLGRAIEALHKKGITILNTEDAKKTGILKDKSGLGELFTTDHKGNAVLTDISNLPVSTYDNRFLGTQVRVDNKVKEKSQIGSQSRAMIIESLYLNGNPLQGSYPVLDEKGNVAYMSESTSDNTQAAVNKLLTSIDNLVNYGLNDFILSMGLREVPTSNTALRSKSFKVKDVDAFRKAIKKLAASEDVNINVKNALNAVEFIEGTDIINLNFDILPNKGKIESQFISKILKSSSTAKINGGGKIQGAPSLLDYGNRKLVVDKNDNSKSIEADKDLKFYRLGKLYGKDITLPAQIKLAPNKQQTDFIYKVANSLGLDFNGALGEVNKVIKQITQDDVRFNEAAKEAIFNKAGFSIPVEVLHLVGYRIPTQSAASMEYLEIAEFLPVQAGELIVVPTGYTAKNGSDFDIDKLYVMSKNLITHENDYYSKIEANFIARLKSEGLSDTDVKAVLNYDFEGLTPKDKTKATILYNNFQNALLKATEGINAKINIYKGNRELLNLENEFIDSYLNIFQSPEYLANLLNPLDSTNLKDDIKKKTSEDDLGSFSKALTSEYNLQVSNNFLTAKLQVGPYAINSKSHKVSQLIDLKAKNTFKSRLNILYNKNGYNIDMRKELSLASEYDVRGVKGVKISDILKELVNAAVDAGKDPFLIKANLVAPVDSVATYMIRRGVPYDFVVDFMTQPVITELRKQLTANKGIFKSIFKNKKRTKEVYREVLNIFKGPYSADIKEFIAEGKTTAALANLMLESKDFEKDGTDLQHKVLFTYLKFLDPANELTNFTLNTNFDTAKPKNIAQSYLKHFKRSVLLENVDGVWKSNLEYLDNAENIMTNSLQKSFYKADEVVRGFSNQLFLINNDLVLKQVAGVQSFMENQYAPKEMVDRLIENYIAELPNFLLQKEVPKHKALRISFNHAARFIKGVNDSNIPLTLIFDGSKDVDNGKDFSVENAFKSSTYITYNKDKTQKAVVKLSKGVSTFDANQVIEGFEDLINQSKYMIEGEETYFLEALAMLQSGFTKSPYYLADILPYGSFTELLNQVINKHFNGNLSTINSSIKDMLEEYNTSFVLGNYTNNYLVNFVSNNPYEMTEADLEGDLEKSSTGVTKTTIEGKKGTLAIVANSAIKSVLKDKVISEENKNTTEFVLGDIIKEKFVLSKPIDFSENIAETSKVLKDLKETCK